MYGVWQYIRPKQTSTSKRSLWLSPASHLLTGVKPERLARRLTSFEFLLRSRRCRTPCFVSEVQTATKTWRTACASVGLKNFRWHDLRHTWASWHAQDGTPLNVLQELGGWESSEMVRRYAHLSTVHLADYVNRRQALSDVSVTVNKKGLSISA